MQDDNHTHHVSSPGLSNPDVLRFTTDQDLDTPPSCSDHGPDVHRCFGGPSRSVVMRLARVQKRHGHRRGGRNSVWLMARDKSRDHVSARIPDATVTLEASRRDMGISEGSKNE